MKRSLDDARIRVLGHNSKTLARNLPRNVIADLGHQQPSLAVRSSNFAKRMCLGRDFGRSRHQQLIAQLVGFPGYPKPLQPASQSQLASLTSSAQPAVWPVTLD